MLKVLNAAVEAGATIVIDGTPFCCPLPYNAMPGDSPGYAVAQPLVGVLFPDRSRLPPRAPEGTTPKTGDSMAEPLEKRFDPRMHTAEHIVNQTMARLYQCGRSFSAHIEKKKSKLDYHFDRALLDEEVRELERRVNAVIESRLPVTEELIDREEARTRFSLERLPDDAGDRIRIIRIGDYDACPCIGPHVTSTEEVGAFRVISTSYEDGVLRIRYKLSSPSTGA
ncbi:MAG: hypothetical protein AB9873_15725 [Syntrophobacteraceae bacterium]